MVSGKYIAYVFLVLLISLNKLTLSQNKQIITSAQLETNWKIIKGAFPDEYVTLQKVDLTKEVKLSFLSCSFKADSTLGYSSHYPKGIRACRHGMPYITASNWKLTGNELYVKMKGMNINKDLKEFEVVYIVESLNSEVLKLKRKKLINSK